MKAVRMWLTPGFRASSISFMPSVSPLPGAYSERIKVFLPYGFSYRSYLVFGESIYKETESGYVAQCSIEDTELFGVARLVWDELGERKEHLCKYRRCW